MDITDFFEGRFTDIPQPGDPAETASFVVGRYYKTVLEKQRRISGRQDSERERSLPNLFDEWLCDPSFMKEKINALEQFYMGIVPTDPAIQKDILRRLEKLYRLYGSLLENSGLPEEEVK